METTPVYRPVGRCIYCDAGRHSANRAKLGDEHIIPEAINGALVLPEASCGECEGKINWFEQYCMKQTLGPLRYALGLKTKRPKERPETLPLQLEVGGEWITREVPVEWAPVALLLPVFDPPEILFEREPTRTNIYTETFKIVNFATGDMGKLREEFGATKSRSYQASLRGDRFGLLLAKIAHAYATAERADIDNFNPVLPDIILRDPAAPPLPYLVGGIKKLLPESTSFNELGLARGETKYGVTWIVPIRLFGSLGAPTYQVVVSVERPPFAIKRRTIR
ncbi:HNH endonuclease [Mesorhizobium sp. B2-3-10]|uniref:HNH endonuclease n=1 Tax=Mesorhizobium sp. B2-3-10 TaxID=2589954 RepID=UPI00112B7E23|nr:HNH endonuclease [Mesorhizobium sp. B2-3-10]TPL97444.1 HNH endonuclease [Mesorhizobium sp. B2-3-10]